ncbi:MAG: helix-turn-helix transcriptional regulator [Dehalococcoidales bacterium]|nr:helix-turn-helix transcriptional regulator [Dehalococcoidales bacterium]
MTRVFDLYPGIYENLSALAHAMELSPSYVSRVRNGKRSINEKFIIGAKKAFPDKRLDELFYFNSDSSFGDAREQYRHIVTKVKE